mgnify:CR=1 FL=1
MKPKVLLAALLATAMAGPAIADSHDAGMSGDRPSRGMSEQSVEARFGAPAAKVPAVGEPPISRWEYANFIVYFEYDKVIHAVNRRK